MIRTSAGLVMSSRSADGFAGSRWGVPLLPSAAVVSTLQWVRARLRQCIAVAVLGVSGAGFVALGVMPDTDAPLAQARQGNGSVELAWNADHRTAIGQASPAPRALAH